MEECPVQEMRTIKPIIITHDQTLLAMGRLAKRVPLLRPFLDHHCLSCIVPHRDQCWIAEGWDDGKGYKKIHWQGRGVYLHRFGWVLFNGPIPDGRVLDHDAAICTSRSCCNPAHLRPMTVQENTLIGGAVLFGKFYDLEETYAHEVRGLNAYIDR